ncbi:MAG: hypothetical protein F6K50_36955 [Moorea sp. SIO3I7]|nr:hypothetical protein [Moorena sp. SIO3I7]
MNLVPSILGNNPNAINGFREQGAKAVGHAYWQSQTLRERERSFGAGVIKLNLPNN